MHADAGNGNTSYQNARVRSESLQRWPPGAAIGGTTSERDFIILCDNMKVLRFITYI